MFAFALLVLSITNTPRPVVDVDRVEVQTVTDSAGRESFRQIVLWRWSYLATGHRFVVADWHIIRTEPNVRRSHGRRVVTWVDSYGNEHRVRTGNIIYTRGLDRELRDREIVPTSARDSYLVPLFRSTEN